jgi:hypothetical protein
MADKKVINAKTEIKNYIAATKVAPEMLVKIGEMAAAVIKDKALYPMFREQILQAKLAEESDLPAKINYPALSVFATMGKLTSQMIASGELKGA